MPKIGIFSGTFDPVHMGHVVFALEAKTQLGLAEVVFLPEISPRLKAPTPIQHRHKMLELSLAGQPGCSSKVLPMPQFTVQETLPELQKMYGDAHLVLLMGSDLVRTFAYRWPGLEDLLATVELAIGLRDHDTKAEIVTILKECAQSYSTDIRFHILPSPHAALASTQIRQGTHTIDDIHPDVAAYIQKHSLYL